MTSSRRLLLVEDDPSFRRVLSTELSAADWQVQAEDSVAAALQAATKFIPEVALLDLRLGQDSGVELLGSLRAEHPLLQAVMLTGHGAVPEAVEAMRQGAFDFLTKPVEWEVLEQALAGALSKHDLLQENLRLRRALALDPAAAEILGESEAVQELRRQIERLADHDAHVLIQGENGTGKELVARALHRSSPRRDQPFVTVNAAALPEQLVASELFGHQRGAFTGADADRIGLFEAAAGGTLFLDEVGELPRSIQPALLRAVQFGEVRPVGSTQSREVDLRILSATNRDLNEAVAEGSFREDLFYRLAPLSLTVPSLRERGRDAWFLAQHFLALTRPETDSLRFAPDCESAFLRHSWPGNVRELQNLVTRLAVLAEGTTIDRSTVETQMASPGARPGGKLPSLFLEDLERLAIITALDQEKEKTRAARLLGVSLKTLYNKLQKYGLRERYIK